MKKEHQPKTVLTVEDKADNRCFTTSAEMQPRVRALCIGADDYLAKHMGAASLRRAGRCPSPEREVLSCLQRKL